MIDFATLTLLHSWGGRGERHAVRVEVPGAEPGSYLLTAAEENPPFVWLRFKSLLARRAG